MISKRIFVKIIKSDIVNAILTSRVQEASEWED